MPFAYPLCATAAAFFVSPLSSCRRCCLLCITFVAVSCRCRRRSLRITLVAVSILLLLPSLCCRLRPLRAAAFTASVLPPSPSPCCRCHRLRVPPSPCCRRRRLRAATAAISMLPPPVTRRAGVDRARISGRSVWSSDGRGFSERVAAPTRLSCPGFSRGRGVDARRDGEWSGGSRRLRV